ncbi:MAG: DUF4097 family beta strand repeat protein [Saprospiraceae bacterium]|nr:DUF4097 family beta strand repeat protein [Saprospiraceae bacterium]
MKIIVTLAMLVLYACNEPQVNAQHVAVNTNEDSELEIELDIPEIDIKIPNFNFNFNYDGVNWEDDYELKDKKDIHQEYDAQSMSLYNLNGEIKIVSHSGNKIIVDITQTISAANEADLAKGKSEVKLGADEGSDLVLYTAFPYDTRPKDYSNNNNHKNKIPYNLELDYTIKVPQNTSVVLSTVNGDVHVANVDGKLNINSVNGDILAEAANYVEKAHTVNGDITVEVANGQKDGSFHTINGDINFSGPESLSAACKFKSMQGDLYTDYENFTKLDATEKSEETKKGKKQFRLNKTDGIVIGNGTSKINFETLNGDVYIKRIK